MTRYRSLLDIGPFRVRVTTANRSCWRTLTDFYAPVMLSAHDAVWDFDVSMRPSANPLRIVRPQIRFVVDGVEPFDPHPAENAFPMFEWGLNWCIATTAHRYLMLHAGTIAFDDAAMILPGTPGSGKSTLSAALHLRGARLLSDEFGLLLPERGQLLPMPRGIPLKNDSIEAISAFDPTARLGPTYPKTRKGRVRHLRPSDASFARQREPAEPRWLVFPTFKAGAEVSLVPMGKTEAFRHLAFNCFNYRLLGETSFRALADLARRVDCYTLEFGSLEPAVEQLRALVEANGHKVLDGGSA